MQELFQNERNKGRAEGRTIEKIEITTAHLRSVMAKLNFDVDQAMDALSIDAGWGCGQILGPCYFKLVPDFACTP